MLYVVAILCIKLFIFSFLPPPESLRGPNKLEFIDLSLTKIIPQDTGIHVNQPDQNDSDDSPLSNIKMLNLSNSLINVDNAMEILGLSLMYNLSEVISFSICLPMFF